MSTIDERKKIAEEIAELTHSVKVIELTLKDKFCLSKNLVGSTYHWDNVSMMDPENILDANICEKFKLLNESISVLEESRYTLACILRGKD